MNCCSPSDVAGSRSVDGGVDPVVVCSLGWSVLEAGLAVEVGGEVGVVAGEVALEGVVASGVV